MSFERDARAALADGQLRGALRDATTLFAERRRAAMATSAGSASAPSSTSHTPSSYSQTNRAATSIASRVLPMPPAPTSVMSRELPRRARTSPICRSRPTKRVMDCCRLVAGFRAARPTSIATVALPPPIVTPPLGFVLSPGANSGMSSALSSSPAD